MNVVMIGYGRWGKILHQASKAIHAFNIVNIIGKNEPTNYRKIAANVEGIILATPPVGRLELIQELYQSKNRVPLFVEKPVVLNLEDLSLLDKLVKKENFYYFVDYTHLFNNAFIKLVDFVHDKIKNGIYPQKVISIGHNDGPIRSNYNPDFDYGPHDLAMLYYLFERKLSLKEKKVINHKSDKQFNTSISFNHSDYKDLNIECLFGNAGNDKQRKFQVDFSDISIICDDTLEENQKLYTLVSNKKEQIHYNYIPPLENSLRSFEQFDPKNPQYHEITQFVTTILCS